LFQHVGTAPAQAFFFILLIILQCLIYGIGNPLTKIAYEDIPPFCCLAIRFVLAAFIMAAAAGRRAVAELRTVRWTEWMPGSLCMAGAYILSNVALHLTKATTVGFLMSLPVLFVPFLAVLVLRRPYRRAFLPVQIMASAGLYLLCCSGGAFTFGWGEALSLTVALCVAGALVCSEKNLRSLRASTLSFVQIAITAVLSAVGALLFERGTKLSDIRPVSWWVILYLALLCSCLAYYLQNTALTHVSAGLVSLAQCTEPVFTVGASYFILGERLSGMGWCGAAILLVCIVYGNIVENTTAKKRLPPAFDLSSGGVRTPAAASAGRGNGKTGGS
jgi:drug/metabolite transporter (DMT)-like permease